MTTKESPLHASFKKLSLEKGVADTLYSPRFDGIYCRVMKTDTAARAIRRGLDLTAAFFNSREIAAQLHMPYLKLCLGVLASRLEEHPATGLYGERLQGDPPRHRGG